MGEVYFLNIEFMSIVCIIFVFEIGGIFKIDLRVLIDSGVICLNKVKSFLWFIGFDLNVGSIIFIFGGGKLNMLIFELNLRV